MGQALGVLVGCDLNQQWLLLDWYSYLRKHNPGIPIAFGDLGMSEDGRKWCKNRGMLIPALQIPLPPPPNRKKEGGPTEETDGCRKA